MRLPLTAGSKSRVGRAPIQGLISAAGVTTLFFLSIIAPVSVPTAVAQAPVYELLFGAETQAGNSLNLLDCEGSLRKLADRSQGEFSTFFGDHVVSGEDGNIVARSLANPSEVTVLIESASSPAADPSGKSFAFTQIQDGSSQVFLMQVEDVFSIKGRGTVPIGRGSGPSFVGGQLWFTEGTKLVAYDLGAGTRAENEIPLPRDRVPFSLRENLMPEGPDPAKAAFLVSLPSGRTLTQEVWYIDQNNVPHQSPVPAGSYLTLGAFVGNSAVLGMLGDTLQTGDVQSGALAPMPPTQITGATHVAGHEARLCEEEELPPPVSVPTTPKKLEVVPVEDGFPWGPFGLALGLGALAGLGVIPLVSAAGLMCGPEGR